MDDQIEDATQTDLVDEKIDEMPPVVDFDQFLADYEVAWEWGLQNLRTGFFQQGDIVVFPTSPDSNSPLREKDSRLLIEDGNVARHGADTSIVHGHFIDFGVGSTELE